MHHDGAVFEGVDVVRMEGSTARDRGQLPVVAHPTEPAPRFRPGLAQIRDSSPTGFVESAFYQFDAGRGI